MNQPDPPLTSYPAKRCWQTQEAAARYRVSRLPANFKRFHLEETILHRWLDGLPSNALILDVPCGTGRFLPTLTSHGYRYLGADISEAMIAEARSQATSPLVEGFIHADAAKLPLPDEHVDCVIIWRLLHHIADATARLAILREAARVTRDRVIISFHHPISFTAVKKRFRRRFLGRGHGTEFTQWRLEREVMACGLELVEATSFRKYISINWFARLAKVRAPGRDRLGTRSFSPAT